MAIDENDCGMMVQLQRRRRRKKNVTKNTGKTKNCEIKSFSIGKVSICSFLSNEIETKMEQKMMKRTAKTADESG